MALDGLINELKSKVDQNTAILHELKAKQVSCDEAKNLYPQLWKKYEDQLKEVQALEFPTMNEIASGLRSAREKTWNDAKVQLKLLQDNIKMQTKEIEELTAEVELCGMVHQFVVAAVERGESLVYDQVVSATGQVVDTAETVSNIVGDIIE